MKYAMFINMFSFTACRLGFLNPDSVFSAFEVTSAGPQRIYRQYTCVGEVQAELVRSKT